MKTIDKTESILHGSIYKVLITLSLPIMFNSLIETLYNLVDGIWVSKISSVHFAATSFVWPINFLFISIGIGISIAGTSLLSQLTGGNKIEEARQYANQLVVTSLILSVFFVFIGIIFSPIIIRAMGGTGALAEYSNIYIRITFLDMPFMFLFFSINSIMTSQGDTVTPTILSAVGAILNIVLDPIFIFTLNMGIAGAAWATLLSRATIAITGFYILLEGNNKIKPNFRHFRFRIDIIKDIIKVGLPVSIGQSGASLGFMVLNGFIVSFGTATLGAFGMVNRITALFMQPAMGIGAALTAIVGQNYGAYKLDRVNESFNKATRLALIIGITGTIIIFVLSEQMVNFFIQSKDDPEVIIQGITYMKYVALSMPLMGMFSVFQGMFQGTGSTRYSMAMEIGRLWFVRLPMILLFKYLTDFGPSGIWFSMSFSNLIVCIFGYWVYKSNRWNGKVELV